MAVFFSFYMRCICYPSWQLFGAWLAGKVNTEINGLRDSNEIFFWRKFDGLNTTSGMGYFVLIK